MHKPLSFDGIIQLFKYKVIIIQRNTAPRTAYVVYT